MRKNEMDTTAARRDPDDQATGRLRETARANFMHALLERKFRPGHLVSQREIVEVTGASLPSVREALKLLEAEGIVTLIPKRGVAINEPGRKEIRDTFQLRSMIELEAIRSYVTQVSSAEIAQLRAETKDLISTHPSTPEQELDIFQQRVELDQRLHREIVAAMKNDLIAAVHKKIETTELLTRLTLPPRFHTEGPAFHEHLALIDQIEKRDAEGARKALKHHLENACERAIAAAAP